MKKPKLSPLLCITVLFVLLTAFIFFSRNVFRPEIEITQISQPSAGVQILSLYRQHSNSENTLVNINTADMETLMLLPGIGKMLAGRIIAYRWTHGPFQQVEDLLNVEGIGPSRLENILNYITTGG